MFYPFTHLSRDEIRMAGNSELAERGEYR